MTEKRWQDAALEEKMEVVKMYNKYYDNTNENLTLEKADWAWTDCRWITIKFTFGVKPIWA